MRMVYIGRSTHTVYGTHGDSLFYPKLASTPWGACIVSLAVNSAKVVFLVRFA